jgi:hypothetical protein
MGKGRMSRPMTSALRADSPERRRRVAVISAAIAVLAVLLVASSPASALIHQGHTFSGSFGEAFGEGDEDKLSGPTSVAVNEANSGAGAGDVYVLDSGNNRVVRFGPAPEHAFVEAWGYGVSDGGAAYQQCTSKCRPGIAGFASAQFSSPVAIAVDNAVGSPSRGDVYVVANRTWKHAVIDKFSPTGVLLDKLVSSKEEKETVEGMIVGVAVDPGGNVYVEREDEQTEFLLERFNNAADNQLIGEPAFLTVGSAEQNQPARPGFAVDSQGDIYVTYEPLGKDGEEIEEEEEEIDEREKARKKAHEEPKNEQPQQPCTVHECQVSKLAVVEEDGELEATPLIYEEAGEGASTTGVAVDPLSADDVFFDNGTDVAAFTASGSLIQRFGSEQLKGGSGLTVNGKTGEVLVADASTGRIDDYVLSSAGAPMVEPGSVVAASVTATSANLQAAIDADGADTHYRFQYGISSCSAASSSCSEEPLGGADVGQGFGDQLVSLRIGNLTPSTTYYFRVIAENQFARGSAAVVSEERTFRTVSSELGAALPDGRAWELVSPGNKHGGAVEAIGGIGGGVVESSSDGRAITYLTSAPVGENAPEANRLPERSQIISSRQQAGKWSAQDIATPNSGQTQGVKDGTPREYQAFSPDLGEAVVAPTTEQKLSPQAGEQTIYLRDNVACIADITSCYQPLVVATTDGSKLAGRVRFKAATADLHHLVLESGVALTPSALPEHLGLYEWSAGQLQLISLLPKGEQAKAEVYVGAESAKGMESTAISADGSRVIFRTGVELREGVEKPGHLYMREIPQAQTLEVDEPNVGAPTPTVSPAPEFQMASSDGSKVFFTDPRRLTADSTAQEGPGSRTPRDLYVFEADKPAGHRLTDLSVDLNSDEGAEVQGAVMGASDDGSFVYFAANGVLAGGAQPGGCNKEAPSNKRCNLYVAHNDGAQWESPRLVARISTEDAPDWGTFETSLKDRTARSSPNGEYLAFMSNVPLTNYNNTDQNSGVRDEEVFLYHYSHEGSGDLICASCNPSGAQPVGVHDIEESDEGKALVVDRQQTWTEGEFGGIDHWLAGNVPGWTATGQIEAKYESRYLSDSGRLFFNSSDALVPRDRNQGKEDVYEYEPKGIGSCETENAAGGCIALISSGESEHESAFMDASESGGDVFFVTAAKLSSQDPDTTFDLYDARVCAVGGAEACPSPPPPPPPAPCDSEACRQPPVPQPSSSSPGSSVLSGSGNIAPQRAVLGETVRKRTTPTRAQKLRAALKKCHKLKQHKKRATCEKRARNRYGVKKKHAKKSSTSSKAPAKPSLRTGR